MFGQYRIYGPLSARALLFLPLGLAAVLGVVLTIGAIGVATGQDWITTIGTLLLIGGPAWVVRAFVTRINALWISAKGVVIGPWGVPWDSVHTIVVYDDATAAVGVQVRSSDKVLVSVPAENLDTTTPGKPVIVCQVNGKRVNEKKIAAALKKAAPGTVKVVHRSARGEVTAPASAGE